MATPLPLDPGQGPVVPDPPPRLAAWGVHLYTATGAVWGLMALQAIWDGHPHRAFLWMAVATFVDATDGWLARRFLVWEVLPHIDGRRLDDIVDYFTYTIVPVAFLSLTGAIPPSPFLAAAPLLASGFGFANVAAKTEDDYFLGFPSYWNIVAAYLWLLGWSPEVNAALLVALSILVFIPIRYIYPSKTKPLQAITLALGVLWAFQMLLAFTMPHRLPSWWVPSSLFFPLYYMGASLYLHLTQPHHSPE